MPRIRDKTRMVFDNGNWVIDEYRFSPNADYTLARGTWKGCELTGPRFEEAEKIFDREISKWFVEE